MIDQEIIRQRLKNQRLTPNQLIKPEQVVAWLGAVHAKDYHGALWALGLRLLGSTQPGVEIAFQEGRILRTHVLKPTCHFVTPQDIRSMLALTARLFASPMLGLGLALILIARADLWRVVFVPAVGMLTFGAAGILTLLLESASVQPPTDLGYIITATPVILFILGLYLLLPNRSYRE